MVVYSEPPVLDISDKAAKNDYWTFTHLSSSTSIILIGKRKSSNRYNCGSTKKYECNENFDLNHVWKEKCVRELESI